MSREIRPFGVFGNVIDLNTYRESKRRKEAQRAQKTDANKRYLLIARPVMKDRWEVAAVPVEPMLECLRIIASVEGGGWQPLFRAQALDDSRCTCPWDASDPSASFLAWLESMAQLNAEAKKNITNLRIAHEQDRVSFIPLSVGAA